jgi:hypothetical protein
MRPEGSALGVRPEGSALGVRPEGSALGVLCWGAGERELSGAGVLNNMGSSGWTLAMGIVTNNAVSIMISIALNLVDKALFTIVLFAYGISFMRRREKCCSVK